MSSIHWSAKRVRYALVFFVTLFLSVSFFNSRTPFIQGNQQLLSPLQQQLRTEELEQQGQQENDPAHSDPFFPSHPNDEVIDPECTITNHQTGQFYDLRELSNLDYYNSLNKNYDDNGGDELTPSDPHAKDFQAWHAKGFDYGKNFSIGICSSPIRQLNALTDLDFPAVANKSNVGGYYAGPNGEKLSIGEANSNLKLRGKQLLLEYENGDICDASNPSLKKSTLLIFHCDREMMSKARISYIGSFHDCSYVFEIRTIHACPAARDEVESNIVAVFFAIVLAAIAVYFGANRLYTLTEYYVMTKKDSKHSDRLPL